MDDSVELRSTSLHSAACSDIVLRETNQVRLIFRPEVFDNPHDRDACVHGRFLYQKKAKNGPWEDFETISLASVKMGEGYQLRLSADETLTLLRQLGALYRYHRREGVPRGTVELHRIERSFALLLALAESELADFFTAHSQDAVRALRLLLRWLSKQSISTDLLSEVQALPGLNALVGLANLRSLMKTWTQNISNGEEEFWQDLLARHSFVLSQLFAYPVVLIKDKAYVGGKTLENIGGNVVDFLLRAETTGAAVLIEIKTPQTRLLAPQYRTGVFPPSNDVNGAISQVLENSETWLTDFHSLKGKEEELSAARPHCLIIVGNANELTDDARKRSFERFRDRLHGVRLVTFDEVFSRIEDLISLLEGGQPN